MAKEASVPVSQVAQAFAKSLDGLIQSVPAGPLRDKLCKFARRALARAQRRTYLSGDDFRADAQQQLKGIDPNTIAAIIAALMPLVEMILASKG
jgi:hypothetical protein